MYIQKIYIYNIKGYILDKLLSLDVGETVNTGNTITIFC